jgi:N-acetylneuraminate synthase
MNDETLLDRYLSDSLRLLRQAAIVLPRRATASIYHHEGATSVYQTGALFIKVVDRDYCKSYVVMQAHQRYPDHYHRIKTESMYVLWGELTVALDGTEHRLGPGEIIHIERGQDHAFYTERGTVFEEISTTYVPNDSVYLDETIRKAPYSVRRSLLNETQWEELLRHAEGESVFHL